MDWYQRTDVAQDVNCVLRARSSSEVAPSQAMGAPHAVHRVMEPAPASSPSVKLHTGSRHHLDREQVCKLGFPFAESKTVTEKAALGSSLRCAIHLTSSVIKAGKDQRRGGGKLSWTERPTSSDGDGPSYLGWSNFRTSQGSKSDLWAERLLLLKNYPAC